MSIDRRPSSRRLVTLGAVAMLSLPTAGGVAAREPQSASFFEPFDGIDGRRWYVSDGWLDGAQQGCTWSREAVQSHGGMLRLRMFGAPNRLSGYKCGELQTTGKYGYGTYEVRMRTADGAGLNTAAFTYSGPPITPVHDEIDFEFLGKKSSSVQLNYYVGAHGGHETLADVPGGASSDFHRYAFVWAPGSIKWYIDDKLVRTASGAEVPSVPGKFYLSLWAGSASVDGWLGHLDAARLPATADVDWAAYTAPGDSCRFPESITCRTPKP